MTTYQVIISDAAARLMGECVLFLAQTDIDAAQRLKERLLDSIRSLETLPARYPFFNEPYLPANKYHKLFVERWFLVLYQIKDDTVYVDYVLDCRQDYGWLIR